MFATEWGTKTKSKDKGLEYKNIQSISSVVWAEHCIECAAPLCFGKCEKYRRRKDGKCRLFYDGINKINGQGLLGYSARIHFQGWSKLEATYRPRQHSISTIRFFESVSNFFFAVFKFLCRLFVKNRKWHLTTFGYKIREGFSALLNKFGKYPDAFFIQITNHGSDVNLILETKTIDQEPIFKKSFLIKKGFNEFFIPFDLISIKNNKKNFVFLYPSNECELIFNALDFVRFKKERVTKTNIAKYNEYSPNQKKIKCVAWDLDNTLWDGVLIEGNVAIREEIKSIILELDKKGIVNSVVSKNNYDEAIKKIKEFGLDDYFVMPQINWLPKSVNIHRLSDEMNIGLDTICFVDDSEFELNEVFTNASGVMCVNINDVQEVMKKECFNVTVSDESSSRRQTYKIKEKEMSEFENWSGNIDDFLRSCQMQIVIKKPTLSELSRCFELMQRTNQLNASGRRLSFDEIKDIWSSNEYVALCISCSDKFGEYGIVGFSIYKKDINTITDFVISCRVANKTIEQTFIQYVFKKYSNNLNINIIYKKTIKNGPMFNILADLKMSKTAECDDDTFIYSYDGNTKAYDIVSIKEQ